MEIKLVAISYALFIALTTLSIVKLGVDLESPSTFSIALDNEKFE